MVTFWRKKRTLSQADPAEGTLARVRKAFGDFRCRYDNDTRRFPQLSFAAIAVVAGAAGLAGCSSGDRIDGRITSVDATRICVDVPASSFSSHSGESGFINECISRVGQIGAANDYKGSPTEFEVGQCVETASYHPGFRITKIVLCVSGQP